MEVEVIDLFAFMDTLPGRIDVLKIDVEGAEAEILEKLIDTRFDRRVGPDFHRKA